jgi:hypothetical protein
LQLPPCAPELNGQENIWQFMRQNWLSNRIFKSFDDIVDHCCYAWNTLIDQPWKIMSIAPRLGSRRSLNLRIGSLHEAAASSGLSSSPGLSCPRDRGSFRRPAHRRHHPGHCGLLERAATLY